MFENLRGQIQLIQHDLSLSLRDLRLNASTKSEMKHRVGLLTSDFHMEHDVNLYAGADVIEYFQKRWGELQAGHVRNAEKARVVGKEVSRVSAQVETMRQASDQLERELVELKPELAVALEEIELEMGKSLTLLAKLEDAITDLTKEVEAKSFEERKIESKNKLDRLRRHKEEELAFHEAQLIARREQKLAQSRQREQEMLRERQLVFQQAFEEEVREYKQKGQLAARSVLEGPTGLTTSSTATSTAAKLEEIALDIADEEVDALEKFLDDDQSD